MASLPIYVVGVVWTQSQCKNYWTDLFQIPIMFIFDQVNMLAVRTDNLKTNPCFGKKHYPQSYSVDLL